MKELRLSTEGVVIGSRSIREYKYQTVVFMERVYKCIIADRNHSFGRENLEPWTYNLLCYIDLLEQTKTYHFGEFERYEALVVAIKRSLETINSTDSNAYVKIVKKSCLRHWEELLTSITARYDLEYERID